MPYLGNTTTSFNVDSNNINNGSITTEKIAAGAVVNADVNDSASIAGTKISADFGAQDLIVDTNLLFVDVSTDRVGVGTSSPGAPLTVSNSGNNKLTLTGGTNQNGLTFDGANGSDSYYIYTSSLGLNFYNTTDSVSALTIDNSNRVGVGTTSPGASFHVAQGDARISDSGATQRLLRVANSAGATEYRIQADGNTYLYNDGYFAVTAGGGSERLRIDSSGRVGIGTSSPGSLLQVGTGALSSNNVAAFLGGSTTFENAKTGNAPTITFNNDLDTGFLNPSANTLGFNTGGSRSITIDSSQRVGIGTTSVDSGYILHAEGSYRAKGTTGNVWYSAANTSGGVLIGIDNSSGSNFGAGAYSRNIYSDGAYPLVFHTNGTQRAQIDSSGRLLVGTTSTSSFKIGGSSYTPQTHLGGGVVQAAAIRASAPYFCLGASNTVSSGTNLGILSWHGSDASNLVQAAAIEAYVDGTPGTNDMPGRLVFSTTADGASSPTERMRIGQNGYLKVSNSGSYRNTSDTYHELNQTQNNNNLMVRCDHASFGASNLGLDTVRSATSAYWFIYGNSGDGADTEFRITGDGNGYCDGSWNGGGADYAEYFEWLDSNPNEEDRRGISVVLDGDKIREAVAGEEPIGVISGNPSMVGDAAWNKWNGKHLRDEFGSYLLDAEGYRQLNPDYDPDAEYIPRADRPEWDCVGLMGKLRIRKGQVTGARWIKMRDVSDNVEEWLVR